MSRQRKIFRQGGCRRRRGTVLIMLMLVSTVLAVLYVSFLARSIAESRATLVNCDVLQAGYLAEAGIDQVKRELFELFETYYAEQGRVADAFDWFDDLTTADGQAAKNVVLPTGATLSGSNGSYSVSITAVDTTTQVPKDVTVVSVATVNGVTRSITGVLRYSMCPSRVFDYSYFVNNYGWFYGGGITSQGDIRSNGNFAFQGNPEVNGDIYASINPDIGAAGTISGNNKNDSVSQYRTQSDTTARPSNPTADPQDIDGDGIPEEFPYEDGYDGSSDRFSGQQLLEMPYLGDLGYYQSLAATNNGTISQGGSTLVTNTYSGNIVLIGTDADPIEIDGPVVVTGDVLIKGKVTGQGTIYSGRNVHILGDMNYVDPPVWNKPDTDPEGTEAINQTKDFLGLAAKGNVIVGDYTRTDWKTNVSSYLKPPFTQAYEVDPTDTGIGYVQYYSGGDPYFDGDYTASDGGTKDDGSSRKFYESSYSDAYFTTIADNSSSIREIDAVVYTNHAFSGKVGAFTWNGSIVSRDEAIVYSGNIDMNYDVRAKDQGGAHDFFLPRQLASPNVAYMKRN